MANSEQYAIDYMTHAMLSASLLEQLSYQLTSSHRNTMTIGQFYDEFNKTHGSQRFRPFNEGVIFGYLYWLLFAKENWPDLVPSDDLSTWTINPVRLLCPKQPSPKLKYLVRRLRNALGHGKPTFTVPAGTTPETMVTAVTITFKDVNARDSRDTFEAELTLKDCLHLTKCLHQIILEDAARRYSVTPP